MAFQFSANVAPNSFLRRNKHPGTLSSPRRSIRNRQIVTAQSNKVKASIPAKLYNTGEKLKVRQISTENAENNTTLARYIVCPKCSTAYIGNAVTKPVKVSCASCGEVFQTSPALLYVGTDRTSETSTESIPKNAIKCKYTSTCSGCTLSRNVDRPPVVDSALEFFARAFFLQSENISIEMDSATQWRTHAKLAVRRDPFVYKNNGVVIGLFKSRSHQVVSIPGCAVHAPGIERVADIVRETIWRSGLMLYDESTGRGTIRYVLFTSQRSTGRVQVTVVWNALSWKDASPEAAVIGSELWRRGRLAGGLIHSIWFNWNTSSGNAIVNPERERFYHMHGEKDLVETVCGVSVTFPPYTFRQANLDAFEKLLLPKLLTYIPTGCQVAELYAGVGVIGLTAIKHRSISKLVASEIHNGAKEEFWKAVTNLRRQGHTRTEVDFLVSSDEEAISFIDENINVVIVDPPRGGLSEEVAKRIAEFDQDSNLERIIYVSCGFESFKRDAKVLCEGRKWKVRHIHLYILFPGSDQLETLAVFDRVRQKKNTDPRSWGSRLSVDRDANHNRPLRKRDSMQRK